MMTKWPVYHSERHTLGISHQLIDRPNLMRTQTCEYTTSNGTVINGQIASSRQQTRESKQNSARRKKMSARKKWNRMNTYGQLLRKWDDARKFAVPSRGESAGCTNSSVNLAASSTAARALTHTVDGDRIEKIKWTSCATRSPNT